MVKKIAIIEDDDAIAQMYRIKLVAEGYKVRTARDGRLGLALVESMHPDIVLLDLMMPEMSGEEVLAKIRETPWGAHLKVLVLTNIDEQAIPESLRQLDVHRILLKTDLTPHDVAVAVNTALRSHEDRT